MASTFSPIPLQLPLALKSKNYRVLQPSVLVPARPSSWGRYTRTISALMCWNGGERRRIERQWIASCSAADNFAGWTDSDGPDQFLQPERKSSLQGSLVAGIILVAAFTHAELSLCTNSRRKQYMEALTAQQEVSLVSTGEDAEDENNTSEKNSVNPDDTTLEMKRITHQDLYVSLELHEAPSENVLDDSQQILAVDDANYTNMSDDDPVEEDLQYKSTIDTKLKAPEITPESITVSDSEIADCSLASSLLQSIPDTNLMDGEPIDLTNIQGHGNDHQGGSSSSYAKENSDVRSGSADAPVEEIVSVTSTVDTVSNPVIEIFESLPFIGAFSSAGVPTLSSVSEVLQRSSASNKLLRTLSIVHPAMYVESDLMPEDPDFSSVQGLSQAAIIARTIGEGSDIVNKEVAHIQAENAVSTRDALVAEFKQEFNAFFEMMDRKLERLRSEREADNVALIKERAANHTVSDSEFADRSLASSLLQSITVSGSEIYSPFKDVNYLDASTSFETTSVTAFANEPNMLVNNDTNSSRKISESPLFSVSSSSAAGIPAPSAGKVLVPAVVDQTQGQALSALQVLKVIEADALPGDLCKRRELAHWNTPSKVYPAMYIENVTELAFDDITPEDPDFSAIQGLAEAGLISSKLSSYDLVSSSDESRSSIYFFPDSPLSRKDLVSWKIALERRQLPEANREILYRLSGFKDIDKINPDAWPALIADFSAENQGITSLAFGHTRLFLPDKPVTKAQAAIALTTGEDSIIVNEDLARIEAESVAKNAAHNALVAQVEKELLIEREKISQLQYELEVERKKAFSMARAEDEAKRARGIKGG